MLKSEGQQDIHSSMNATDFYLGLLCTSTGATMEETMNPCFVAHSSRDRVRKNVM